MGDAIASHTEDSPSRKLPARQAEGTFNELERKDNHPRR